MQELWSSRTASWRLDPIYHHPNRM